MDQVVFPHPSQDVRYTSLPKDLPTSIAAIARAWTQGQPNDYRKILAIQDRLRSFTYDTTVAGWATLPIGANQRTHYNAAVEALDTEIGRLLSTMNGVARNLAVVVDQGVKENKFSA